MRVDTRQELFVGKGRKRQRERRARDGANSCVTCSGDSKTDGIRVRGAHSRSELAPP